jgi:hypothetical protein
MKNVNKIIHIKNKQNNLINFIKDLLKKAENGEITKLITVSDDNNSNDDAIMTGYYNCSFMDRQLLITTLQLDLSYKMVEANVDKLIEIINE